MSIVLTDELTRRASSKDRILEALRAAGATGCTNHELNVISYRYGARILDLRKAEYRIDSIHEHDGTWRFVLRTDTPQPGQPGFLASLPVVASINPRVRVTPTTDDTPRDGCLF